MNDREKLDNNLLDSAILLHKTVQSLCKRVESIEGELKRKQEKLDAANEAEYTFQKDGEATELFTESTLDGFKKILDQVAVRPPRFWVRYISNRNLTIQDPVLYHNLTPYSDEVPVYCFTREMLIQAFKEISAHWTSDTAMTGQAALSAYLNDGGGK